MPAAANVAVEMDKEKRGAAKWTGTSAGTQVMCAKKGVAQQQWQSVPLPEGFQPSAGTDKEAIVYQPSTGRYWEFWAMERSGRKVVDSAGRRVDEWRADRGTKINDLARNPGYFPTTPEGYKFGTTARGLALLAGLVTITNTGT